MFTEENKMSVPVIVNTYPDDESGMIVNEITTKDGEYSSMKWTVDLVDLVHSTIAIHTIPDSTNLTIEGRYIVNRLADHFNEAATAARAMLKISGTRYE